jgi:signal transduction histidine kinase/CheY-like chemotaxis protein
MKTDDESSSPSTSGRFLRVPAHPNRLETERSRILTTILTAGACVSGMMFILCPLWREKPGPYLIGYGLTFFLHVIHIGLVRSGRPLLAARSFSVFFFLLITVMTYAYGGIRGFGAFSYPLVVLFVGLTWSGIAAVGMALAASATALVMALIESGGLMTMVEPIPSVGAAWSIITASVVMTAVMLFVAIRVIRTSADEAVESESKRRKLRTELARAQRMESLGKLAGGVAHDFNNMLTGIIGHAELMSLKVKNDTELLKHSKIILDTGQRAARLTRQLLTFSRRGDQTLQLTSVNQSIENVVSILERSIDRRINVETRFSEDHDQVRADPALLESAFLNLAINARDALPEGGWIRFETDIVDPPPVIVSLMDHRTADQYVRARVSDNGIGISSSDLDRVFDPYFTTKEREKGTGLGLSAVYGTIRDYGGTVNVESQVGTGTTFTIYLPVARGTPKAPREENRPEQVPDIYPRCILAIDDEIPVLELVREVLEDLGHTALVAHDPHEGLDLFARRMDQIDLVILDIVMPKMSGRQVFKQIRERRETLPVILTSGYSDELLDELLRLPGVQFLQKPYRRDELAALLSQASLSGADK